MKGFILLGILMLSQAIFAQRPDSLVTDSVSGKKLMVYKFKDRWLYYPKPKPFGFIAKIPRTFYESAGMAFNKKSLPRWGIMAASTGVLLLLDERLLRGTQNFSHYIHLDNTRIYHDVVGFKIGSQQVTIYEAPGNLNTFFYQIGEGLPSLLVCAGLAIYGNVKNDYRARSTATQIAQTFVAMGISTQLMKRVFGRESPYLATAPGGAWRPFPNWKTYQHHVPAYDAFPSGHMATLMATAVVLSDNYPEKHWIKPVGYSLMGLVGLAMINNGVHWASDYPLAIGLGYVTGKATVKLNRILKMK